MKLLHSETGVVCDADRDQLDLMLEAGWEKYSAKREKELNGNSAAALLKPSKPDGENEEEQKFPYLTDEQFAKLSKEEKKEYVSNRDAFEAANKK